MRELGNPVDGFDGGKVIIENLASVLGEDAAVLG